jgi:hypothetical protein
MELHVGDDEVTVGNSYIIYILLLGQSQCEQAGPIFGTNAPCFCFNDCWSCSDTARCILTRLNTLVVKGVETFHVGFIRGGKLIQTYIMLRLM